MDKVIANLVEIIVRTCNPQNIFLFGSRAAGNFDSESADMDFRVAEYLLGMKPDPQEIICFHCQQSVENI